MSTVSFSLSTLPSLLTKSGAESAVCSGPDSRTDTFAPTPEDQQTDHTLHSAALPVGGTFAGSD